MDQGTVLDMATDQDTVLSLAIHRPAGAQVSITDRVSYVFEHARIHLYTFVRISFPIPTDDLSLIHI